MWSAYPSFRPPTLLVLFCVGALVGAGCDGGASKRESFYQRLVGTWTAERLVVGGQNRTTHLDERYTALRIDFRSGGGRTYRLTGTVEDDTTLLARGHVDMLSAQRLQMRPGQGFEGPVTWSFEFEGSRALFEMPEDRRTGSEEFLTTILPGGSWGDAQHVELRLARDP